MGLKTGLQDGEVVAAAGEVGAADQPAVGEERADVVAVPAAGGGFVGLEDLREAEQAQGAGPVPDQVVERAEEYRLAVWPQGAGEGVRVGPGRCPARDPGGDEAGGGQEAGGDGCGDAEVVGEVVDGGDAERFPRVAQEPGQAHVVGFLVGEVPPGNAALGEVEQALPAGAAGGGEFPGPEKELHGHFRRAPVPAGARLGVLAEISHRERAVAGDPVQQCRADVPVGVLRAATGGSAPERPQWPVGDRHEAEGVPPTAGRMARVRRSAPAGAGRV
nr:hypothetical protein [Streptomyces anulatus]